MRRPIETRLAQASDPDRFVLGRDRFAKISAVEGILLTDEMHRILDEFDRKGLVAEERRRAILRRFSPPR